MALRLVEPLETVISDLEQRLPRALKAFGVPGASVSLIRGGASVWSRGFGFANAKSLQPVTTDTVFEAYSCSKPLVATHALQLCRQGVIDLDEPLAKFLDEPFVRGDPRIGDITLRTALSHCSGLPDDEPTLTIEFLTG